MKEYNPECSNYCELGSNCAIKMLLGMDNIECSYAPKGNFEECEDFISEMENEDE